MVETEVEVMVETEVEVAVEVEVMVETIGGGDGRDKRWR